MKPVGIKTEQNVIKEEGTGRYQDRVKVNICDFWYMDVIVCDIWYMDVIVCDTQYTDVIVCDIQYINVVICDI